MKAIFLPRLRTPTAGFSLVEVSLAIGIIAFAFVALFALIPTGLGEMRTAADASNGTRIVQNVVSRALATNYKDLSKIENVIYYYDNEGLPVDSSDAEDANRKESRLYAARVFIEPAVVESGSDLNFTFSSRLIIAFGHLLNSQADKLEDADSYDKLKALLAESPGKTGVIIRSATIAKTDGK